MTQPSWSIHFTTLYQSQCRCMHSIEFQDHVTYLPSDDGAAWSSLVSHNSLSFRPQYLHSIAVISVAQPNSRTPQQSSDTSARQPNHQKNPLLSGEHTRRKNNNAPRSLYFLFILLLRLHNPITDPSIKLSAPDINPSLALLWWHNTQPGMDRCYSDTVPGGTQFQRELVPLSFRHPVTSAFTLVFSMCMWTTSGYRSHVNDKCKHSLWLFRLHWPIAAFPLSNSDIEYLNSTTN